MALLRERRCTDCGRHYEVLEANGEAVGMDADHTNCPNCESTQYCGVISVPMGIDLGDEAGYSRTYPYDDRTLGRVHSAAHRKQLMRARGLEEGCIGQAIRDSEARERDEDAAHARVMKQRDLEENAPEYVGYRRLRSRGAYDEQFKSDSDPRGKAWRKNLR